MLFTVYSENKINLTRLIQFTVLYINTRFIKYLYDDHVRTMLYALFLG